MDPTEVECRLQELLFWVVHTIVKGTCLFDKASWDPRWIAHYQIDLERQPYLICDVLVKADLLGVNMRLHLLIVVLSIFEIEVHNIKNMSIQSLSQAKDLTIHLCRLNGSLL